MDMAVRIYYEDTDAGGVVYHSRYLNFFERARTEYLRESGYSQQILLSQSIAFMVKSVAIEYQASAHLDDLLNVTTKIMELKKASMVFQQALWRDDILLCEARVVVASVDLIKMKPVVIPKTIQQSLQSLLVKD